MRGLPFIGETLGSFPTFGHRTFHFCRNYGPSYRELADEPASSGVRGARFKAVRLSSPSWQNRFQQSGQALR